MLNVTTFNGTGAMEVSENEPLRIGPAASV
jgi:hypothetical protein